jgi:hypothetical protein
MIAAGFYAGAAAVVGCRQIVPRLGDIKFVLSGRPMIIWVRNPDLKISSEQGQAINSFKVTDWCVQRGVDVRRYRHDSNLVQLSGHTRRLMQHGLKYGQNVLVTCDRKGRARVWEIPEGVDAALELLESIYG